VRSGDGWPERERSISWSILIQESFRPSWPGTCLRDLGKVEL